MSDKVRITLKVYGIINDIGFHMIKCCSDDLHGRNSEEIGPPQIFPMLEYEWNTFITHKKQQINGEMWVFNEKAIVYANNFFIGGAKDFLQWAQLEQCYENFRPVILYNSMADKAYETYLKSRKHDFVFLEFKYDNEIIGKIIIELFSDLVPRTCNNFRSLCTEESGYSKSSVFLSYKNSPIHRIVKDGWIQGGDIINGKGNAGESIYGGTFEDENFVIEHNQAGIIGMANQGRHSNASQFYITLQPAPWMDKKYVAFGQVIEGSSTMNIIENVKTLNDRPMSPLIISDCGLYFSSSSSS